MTDYEALSRAYDVYLIKNVRAVMPTITPWVPTGQSWTKSGLAGTIFPGTTLPASGWAEKPFMPTMQMQRQSRMRQP